MASNSFNLTTPNLPGLGLVDRQDVATLAGTAAGSVPGNPNTTTYAGGSTSSFWRYGTLTRQISSTGVSPGATAADNVIATFSIPASFFDVANREIIIEAFGQYAATANTKQEKIIIGPATAVVGSTVGAGGVTIADTGAVTSNNLRWNLRASVTKYGAAGSNTQISVSTADGTTKPALLTQTESAAILVAITGNATTATTDIVFNELVVRAANN